MCICVYAAIKFICMCFSVSMHGFFVCTYVHFCVLECFWIYLHACICLWVPVCLSVCFSAHICRCVFVVHLCEYMWICEYSVLFIKNMFPPKRHEHKHHEVDGTVPDFNSSCAHCAKQPKVICVIDNDSCCKSTAFLRRDFTKASRDVQRGVGKVSGSGGDYFGALYNL